MSSSNPAPTNVAHPKARGKMPEPYNGKPETYRGFRTQMKVYLRINKDVYDNDEDRCLFILSMIQDGNWAQLYAETAMDEMITSGKFVTIDVLWGQLDDHFIDRNAEDQAAAQLEKFQQKGLTAREFFIQFIALAFKAGIVVTETHHFQYLHRTLNRNLNAPLVDNLYRRDSIPTTFATYRETVENLDTVWRQRMEDVKGRDRPQRSEEIKKGNDAPKKKSGGREDVPMEVDRNRGRQVRIGRLSDDELKKHREEGLCFKCHEKGHVGRNCTKNASGSTPQKKQWDIRAMTTEEREELMTELKGFAQADA